MAANSDIRRHARRVAAVALGRRPSPEHGALTWPLASGDLERLQIRWPSVYQWGDAARWVDSLLLGLRQLVAVDNADVPQPYSGIVLLEVVVGGTRHDIAIDYSDYSAVNEECARRCSLYFKMQYLSDGYGQESIVPGGFPPSDVSLYRQLTRLRRRRAAGRFEHEVFGRFSPAFAAETRRKAVTLLEEQREFSYEGGLATIRYSRYLRDVAASRVCVDLPGKGDFCFRLVDYLAIGSCVVGPRPRTVLHSPLVDGRDLAYCRDDLSDLVSLCRRYVDQDDDRERLARGAREYFDRNLQPRQWAAYYLHTLLERTRTSR
jgi:hypothetical protein